MQFLTQRKHSKLALITTVTYYCLARQWKWLDWTSAILGRRDRRGQRLEAGRAGRRILRWVNWRGRGPTAWAVRGKTVHWQMGLEDVVDCVTGQT